MLGVGYRAGPVERKTEFQSQFTGGSRSTGYFGTGYYFTTKPENCMHLDDGERPLYKLTFKDDLKWFIGDRKKHEDLKKLSTYVYNYNDIKKYDDTLYNLSKIATDMKGYEYEDSLFEKLRDDYLCWGKDEGFSWVEWRDYDSDIKRLMNKLKEFPYTVEFYNELASEEPDWDKLIQMEKENPLYFDHSRVDSLRELKFNVEEILPIHIYNCDKEFIRDFAERHINYQDENRYGEADSITTVFLKELGYDGVWPEEECDNTTYGGVIFEKDSIANIELLAEKGNQYIKENCMRKAIKSDWVRINETDKDKLNWHDPNFPSKPISYINSDYPGYEIFKRLWVNFRDTAFEWEIFKGDELLYWKKVRGQDRYENISKEEYKKNYNAKSGFGSLKKAISVFEDYISSPSDIESSKPIKSVKKNNDISYLSIDLTNTGYYEDGVLRIDGDDRFSVSAYSGDKKLGTKYFRFTDLYGSDPYTMEIVFDGGIYEDGFVGIDYEEGDISDFWIVGYDKNGKQLDKKHFAFSQLYNNSISSSRKPIKSGDMKIRYADKGRVYSDSLDTYVYKNVKYNGDIYEWNDYDCLYYNANGDEEDYMDINVFKDLPEGVTPVISSRKSIKSSKQIKSALWDHNKAAVDEIMKYCDDLHLPCGVAGNTFTVAKDFIQGPYKNIDFESVEQVKKEIDNFVKSSKLDIIKCNKEINMSDYLDRLNRIKELTIISWTQALKGTETYNKLWDAVKAIDDVIKTYKNEEYYQGWENNAAEHIDNLTSSNKVDPVASVHSIPKQLPKKQPEQIKYNKKKITDEHGKTFDDYLREAQTLNNLDSGTIRNKDSLDKIFS